jgi:NAD+ diphosphatase
VTSLDGLALSRATVDRSAERRNEPSLFGELLADPRTALVLLAGDRVLVDDGTQTDGDGGSRQAPVALGLLSPAEVGEAVVRAALPLYLGQDGPVGHLALALPAPDVGGAEELLGTLAAPGRRWAGLREVGTLLDDTGAGLFTAALALANWHAVHPRCARCGTPTVVVQAGWARSCPACGAEHYPRTDPAVIMAIVDDEGRLLLGRQAAWPPKRYSTLAGFVEPGESLEAAVRREVAEEAGVVVGEVEYRGSQPWPFPSSLMLGFRGHAVGTAVEVAGVELALARWWTRAEFEADLAAGELMLPPRVSIARRLIEDWYGGPVGGEGVSRTG